MPYTFAAQLTTAALVLVRQRVRILQLAPQRRDKRILGRLAVLDNAAVSYQVQLNSCDMSRISRSPQTRFAGANSGPLQVVPQARVVLHKPPEAEVVHRCRLAAQGLVTERVTLVHVGAGGGHGDHVFGGQSDELL